MTMAEGPLFETTATFTVTFDGASYPGGQPVGFEGGFTADVVVTPIGHPATHGTMPFLDSTDFNVGTQSLTFTGATGQSLPVTVTVNNDNRVEADEQFRIAVRSPDLEAVVPTSIIKYVPADVTIKDNDTAIVQMIAVRPKVTEGDRRKIIVEYHILGKAIDAPVGILTAVIGGAEGNTSGLAVNGEDFGPAPMRITRWVPALERRATIKLNVVDDLLPGEGTETFDLQCLRIAFPDGLNSPPRNDRSARTQDNGDQRQ